MDYNELGNYYVEDKYNKEREKKMEYYKEKEKINKKKRLMEKKNNNINNNNNNNNNQNNSSNNNNQNEEEYSFNVENDNDNGGFSGNYTLYSDIFPKFEIYDEQSNENNTGRNTVIEIPKSHYSGRNMWVIKAINLNRGMCIKIVDNFEEMEQVIYKFKNGVDYHFTEQIINETNQEINNLNNYNHINLFKDKKEKEKPINNNQENSNNNNINKDEEKNSEEKEKNESIYYCDKIIIQKYIENPLLYRGRKCDMRIWVLLTHQMKVYMFKEGHLKTCSLEYYPNSKDAFRHITNYSFQKYNDNFQKFEKGNEVPFFEFQKFIDEKYPEKNYKLNINLINKLKEIITITMRSVKDKINKNGYNYQFEIFGYDFMLDNDFNIYLIEINTNPGLEESSPWIKVIVPRMLDDALRLTLDQIFEPKYDFSLNYKDKEQSNNLKNVENNLKNQINPNCINTNNKNIIEENKIEQKEKNINENNENKNNEEKNKKYISPFPIPGYELDDNLWEFVCDLNIKDPLDNNTINKETIKEKESFTGIRHLLKKKNTKTN